MLYAKNDSLYDYNNINDFNLVKEYLDYNSSIGKETYILSFFQFVVYEIVLYNGYSH